MSNEGYMDKPVWPQQIETEQPADGIEFPDPMNLHNPPYFKQLSAYFKCVTYYLNEFDHPQLLEKQLGRRDLDTVCAYELY